MDEWRVGDPADWGANAGVPDIPYMGYLNGGDEGTEPERPTYSDSLREKAWRLRNEERLDEALETIDRALSTCGSWQSYNVKAIILEDMGKFEEALKNYDEAMRRSSAAIVRDNKARLLERMAQYHSDSWNQSLEYINMAISLTLDDEDRSGFLRTKADILERLGKPRDAYVAIKLANRQYDMVDRFEKHTDILKSSKDTLISVAGTRFYDGLGPFDDGAAVDLVREPDNEHDSDAIRVEAGGKTVGYVANSGYTLIDEVKSASELKDVISSHAKAEVMFIYMERYVIAKLIR